MITGDLNNQGESTTVCIADRDNFSHINVRLSYLGGGVFSGTRDHMNRASHQD